MASGAKTPAAWAAIVALLLSLGVPANHFSRSVSLTPDVCQALSASVSLRDQVFYPSQPAYLLSESTYFSIQEKELQPACIVKPASANDVSTAINILSGASKGNESAVKFAVRSGGHTPWAGSANIDGGVTLDLQMLNQISVQPDRKSVIIGTGSTWGNAYNTLDAMNLSISGGRAAQVGVGGLSLGGGLSFFAPRKGFVCDNIISFEIVLANGEIIQASQDSHPDLWLALKGGSNNFGIVTSFTVISFDQGQVWGGQIFYDILTAPQQLQAVYDFTLSKDYDEYATIIQSFGFMQGPGSVAVNGPKYTKPQAYPPSLKPFTDIPSLVSTQRITNLTDITTEQGGLSAGSFRQLYITTTFQPDMDVLQAGFHIWNETRAEVSDVPGVVWGWVNQPLPPIITRKAIALGANVLGLTDQPPLIITQLSTSWINQSDDELIITSAKKLINVIEAKAKTKGVYNKFKYLNYAWSDQDPIDGYGPENKARLQEVSRKYDPGGLFQSALVGGFKLF